MAGSYKDFYMELPPNDTNDAEHALSYNIENHAEHDHNSGNKGHAHNSHDVAAGDCGEHVLVTGEEAIYCDICNKVPPLQDPPDSEEAPERYVAWHAVFNTPLTVAAGSSTQTPELDEDAQNIDTHGAGGTFHANSLTSTNTEASNHSKRNLRLKLKTLWSSLNIKRRRTKSTTAASDVHCTSASKDEELRSEGTDYSRRMSWMNFSLNGSNINSNREFYNSD